MYACMNVCMNECMCIYTYIYIYTHVCVTYIYIYIYLHIHTIHILLYCSLLTHPRSRYDAAASLLRYGALLLLLTGVYWSGWNALRSALEAVGP